MVLQRNIIKLTKTDESVHMIQLQLKYISSYVNNHFKQLVQETEALLRAKDGGCTTVLKIWK